MLVDALLGILQGLIGWLVSLLPAWTIDLPDGVDTFLYSIKSMDWLFPISEAMFCLNLFLVLVAGLWGWKWTLKLVDWVADILP